MRNILSKATRVTWPGEKGRSAGMEDQLIIDYFGRKNNGYLLDIAAACPISGSLSYKLLDIYEWNGILVEPSVVHRENIEACYGDVDGVDFYFGAIHQSLRSVELYEPDGIAVGCASIDPERMNLDWLEPHSKRSYSVEAIPIMELLKRYNAPKDIDFLNLDIEGSEQNVLNYLNFDEYNVKLICIEDGIDYKELMEGKGYKICEASGYNFPYGNLFYEKVS